MKTFTATYTDIQTGMTDFSEDSSHFFEFGAPGWTDALQIALDYGLQHNADLDALEIER